MAQDVEFTELFTITWHIPWWVVAAVVLLLVVVGAVVGLLLVKRSGRQSR